ncbi:MAG: trypsin-like peptidase domain-containing protein [Elusimicrobia bacterium]|nr:trypsin-like peptidase domain-containing protein [Elusimicrobiota bacterium]
MIYGTDDRVDLYEVANPLWRRLADSTVALVHVTGADIYADGGDVLLLAQSLEETAGVCKDERFREQPAAAFCSGVLVGPDLVMTAGHCVPSAFHCKSTLFMFGFAMRHAADSPIRVDSPEVYRCEELIWSSWTGPLDAAVVRLSRRVSGHEPLPIRREILADRVPDDAALIAIGHPQGLPVKIVSNAGIRDNSHLTYFVTDMDAYPGSSGSAVLNAESGVVEGILVRRTPTEDFLRRKRKFGPFPWRPGFMGRESCGISATCQGDDCGFAHATRAAILGPHIPPLETAASADPQGVAAGDEDSFESPERF